MIFMTRWRELYEFIHAKMQHEAQFWGYFITSYFIISFYDFADFTKKRQKLLLKLHVWKV